MEKELKITLKGEGKHADSMEFNLSNEEIRDFFGDVTALLVLNETAYKYFRVALVSCVETMDMIEATKGKN
jgi:hypothetical protein